MTNLDVRLALDDLESVPYPKVDHRNQPIGLSYIVHAYVFMTC